jgi:hypothetical protein
LHSHPVGSPRHQDADFRGRGLSRPELDQIEGVASIDVIDDAMAIASRARQVG